MNDLNPAQMKGFNLARFCIQHRQVAWALLVLSIAAGIAGYQKMPKRKDPDIPVRIALAVCPWPGVPADRVEELVTRKLEEAAAGNSKVKKIESTTRDGVSVVRVHLYDDIADTVEQFADIGNRVTNISNLPTGAGPVNWVSDFGDTATLMLTVASPKVGATEVRIRGLAVQKALEQERAGAPSEGRVAAMFCFPSTVATSIVERPMAIFAGQALHDGVAREAHSVTAAGCSGLDLVTDRSEAQIREYTDNFLRERLGNPDLHPDAWRPAFIRNAAEAPARLAEVAGDLYSYRELDDFTHEIERVIKNVEIVAKVSRSGVLGEQIWIDYDQDRLASSRMQPSSIASAVASRNMTLPGGTFDVTGRHVVLDPNVRDDSYRNMEDMLIGSSTGGTPVYLRDVASVSRGYDSPPRYLNYFYAPDDQGRWQRSRAITLAMMMRSGQQVGDFAVQVDKMLGQLQRKLPPDLIVARTSDQPRQVAENVSLFMTSLYEAIFLVVVVSLIGFWSWRTALLIATSIPLSLALGFAAMLMLGVDIQQVSIATLIIALGLLVDMPVVAGDAIARELAEGQPKQVAAWIGPTRLARAIFFATLTNVVAYLPFLMLTGDTGRFLHSLPIVMTTTLVAAFIVSFSFIPLIAFGLMRPAKPEEPIEERRKKGFTGWYSRMVLSALNHRKKVLAASCLILVGGGVLMAHSKTQFFPKDLSYLSYIDVWTPEDASLEATNTAAVEAEKVIREVAEEYGKHHQHPHVLRSLTTFVGGAGPRFWFSLEPEQQQINYAQIVVEVTDKHFTNGIIGPMQAALTSKVPGARIDVRQLETGKPVGIPVSIRVSGEDIDQLRKVSGRVADALRATPFGARVRDNWGPPGLTTHIKVDDDRANLSGVTRLDVALSTQTAISGTPVGHYREGDRQIPIVPRLRLEDRARLADLSNAYVFSTSTPQSVPLRQVARLERELAPSKIQRRNQVRTITVSAYPLPDHLPSEVLNAALPAIKKITDELPPGYRIEIGGEYDEQVKGFGEMSLVMLLSMAMIYFALVFQFDSAVKPLLVFGAIPYGMCGALAMLAIMHQPFGFMAFLGVASLVGVIVSHVIVLFDFIEEAHHHGRDLEDALIEAGIVRLRPVMITVGATVLGLIPLAMHGGPLWEPLCYAQIGGLSIATVITLVLVPLMYTVFVRDLRIVPWHAEAKGEAPPPPREDPHHPVLPNAA
jgi:multidrug efflux pump